MNFNYCYSVLVFTLLAAFTSAKLQTKLTELHDIELTSGQILSLCQALNSSRLTDHQAYLWTEVHSDEEPGNNQENFAHGCYKLKYKSCGGQPRYPLSEDCGFFAPVQDENCLLKKNPQQSSSTQHISMTHGTAAHLCTGVHNLPTDSPFSVNYLPIKILINPQEKRGSLSRQCVHWVHRTCGSNDAGSKNTCGEWNLEINEDEKCHQFFDFMNKFNFTDMQRYPNPSLHKTDYLEGTVADEGAPAWTTSFLSSIVKCFNKKGSVHCEVAPQMKDSRSKRAAAIPKIPISRVKRHCCNFYKCGPCGLIRYFGRQTEECNCSNAPDDYCAGDGVGCNKKIAPNFDCSVCCGYDCYPPG